MIWANLRVTFLKVKVRLMVNFLGILFVIITFSLIKQSLYLNNVGGPSALVLMTYPNWLIILLLFLYLVVLPLLPVGIYFILKLVNVCTQPIYLLYSVFGILLSIPVSVYLSQFIFPYQKNLIHAIKTGLIIPFVMISTGILLLGKISSEIKEPVSADILDENLQ
jgi:hypothetical protein